MFSCLACKVPLHTPEDVDNHNLLVHADGPKVATFDQLYQGMRRYVENIPEPRARVRALNHLDECRLWYREARGARAQG